MLQGPMGLTTLSGRVCTNISYNGCRKKVHDTVIPATSPDTPQISYTPMASDMPVFSGHPVGTYMTEAFDTLYTCYKLFTVRNHSNTYKMLTIAYRTSGTNYSTYTAPINNNMMFSFLMAWGLDTPGLGLEENIKLYSEDSNGFMELHESYFAIVPYKIHCGLTKDLYNFRLISTEASLFGGNSDYTDSIRVTLRDSNNYYSARLNDEEFANLRIRTPYTYTLMCSRQPLNFTNCPDMNTLTHNAIRYPLAYLYNSTMR